MLKHIFMNSKIFMLLLSSAISLGLIGASCYITIDNIIAPKGTLFEAAVLFSIGVLIGLMVTIAMSIGQTILVFGEIMQQQIKLQQEMRNISNVSQGRESLQSFLSNILPPEAKITKISIDDFNLKSLAKDLKENAGQETKEFGDMNLTELEKELSKAIVEDDFERAQKINKAIKLLGESGDSESLEKKD